MKKPHPDACPDCRHIHLATRCHATDGHHHGEMRSVTVKAGKTQGSPRSVTAKVAGSAQMVDLVGLQVEIEEGEPNLPGVDDKPRRRGKDAAAGTDA